LNWKLVILRTVITKFKNKKGNGFYGDLETNCKKYYYCAFTDTSFSKIYYYTCPDDYRFSMKARKCIKIEDSFETGTDCGMLYHYH
jgi:hypothetical protein